MIITLDSPHPSAAQSKQSVWEDVALSPSPCLPLSLSLSLCPSDDRTAAESSIQHLHFKAGRSAWWSAGRAGWQASLRATHTSVYTGAPSRREHWHWFTYTITHTQTHTDTCMGVGMESCQICGCIALMWWIEFMTECWESEWWRESHCWF